MRSEHSFYEKRRRTPADWNTARSCQYLVWGPISASFILRLNGWTSKPSRRAIWQLPDDQYHTKLHSWHVDNYVSSIKVVGWGPDLENSIFTKKREKNVRHIISENFIIYRLRFWTSILNSVNDSSNHTLSQWCLVVVVDCSGWIRGLPIGKIILCW